MVLEEPAASFSEDQDRRPPMILRLDPQRIQRPGRRIEWPCSLSTRMRFREMLTRLVECESLSQRDPEVQQEMEALREDLRALPGFPKRYDVERDWIVPITTTAMR